MQVINCLILFLLFLTATRLRGQTVTGPGGEVFAVRVVCDKLADPWEVSYGPDGFLWVTEAKGYTVSRINPVTGKRAILLDVSNHRNFPRYDKIADSLDGGKPWPQGGLMGMALHPQLLSDKPYVYLSYLYHYDGVKRSGNGNLARQGGQFFRARIVRYVYHADTQTLSHPVTLCDTIPGSSDHNAGRMIIAPVEDKAYLFYSVGDMGAGQFDNGGRPNRAQVLESYEGKVLRFNLEPDADEHPSRQWIPNDNPFPGTRPSAVWSYGHRNAQGLAYAAINGVGRLYSSEHGPFSDDEVNIIEKGKNYGHPLVIGLNDNNYNGLAAGASEHTHLPGTWHTTYPTISSENANATAIGPDLYRDPIKTLYPLSNAFLTDVLTRTKQKNPRKPTWPSEAPSSIAVYTASVIPGWQHSLLLPTLKEGKLIRLSLNEKGDQISGDTINYFKASLRYRDIALSTDGRSIYLAVDSSSVTSGPTQENPKGSTCKGCILEFTYQTNSGQANRTQQGLGDTQVSPERAYVALLTLVREMDKKEQRAKRAALTPRLAAIFELLSKPTLTEQDKVQVQEVATELLDALQP